MKSLVDRMTAKRDAADAWATLYRVANRMSAAYESLYSLVKARTAADRQVVDQAMSLIDELRSALDALSRENGR